MACGDRMDDADLMTTLQKHIDDVISQGYQIEDVTIHSKRYADEGPDGVGQFHFMFIKAISPDTTIKYLANFSYSGESLRFHGYPVDSNNKVKTDMTSRSIPNLPDMIAKLDEMKKVLPNGFKYQHLLYIKYTAEGDVYDVNLEVKPDNENLTHPKVKQEKKSYVKYSTTRTRKKFGTTQEKNNTDIKRKIEYTVSVRLTNNQIEIR